MVLPIAVLRVLVDAIPFFSSKIFKMERCIALNPRLIRGYLVSRRSSYVLMIFGLRWSKENITLNRLLEWKSTLKSQSNVVADTHIVENKIAETQEVEWIVFSQQDLLSCRRRTKLNDGIIDGDLRLTALWWTVHLLRRCIIWSGDQEWNFVER